MDKLGPVIDLKWNLFNDNVLASASVDCTIKIWHVNDDTKSSCVRSLNRHYRRVDQIEWHTTVDNVLLSSGSDSRICLWDIEAGSLIFESQKVYIFDSRTGDVKKSSDLPHNGGMPPKVIFINNQRLITFGSSKINRRQMAYYNLSSFGSVVTTVDIDGASGQLLPIFDPDLRIIYVTGKVEDIF
uniref:Coronin n=1 Tax=Heterorhabditis bacteriophora TaxID=37862 RepID=A0A1I7WFT3_HETBA